MSSTFRTALLLGLLTALILAMGQALGGPGGLALAGAVALAMNLGSWWFSDRIVLTMYKARELSPVDAPGLHAMVAELAEAAGVPKPRLALVPTQTPNAFATGRTPSKAVVAVTEGLLRLLPPDELRGVLAHEMGHVRNRDILIQSVAAVLAGAIMMVASWMRWVALLGWGGQTQRDNNPFAMILMAILAPVAAMLIQMAISRSREFGADRAGAEISGRPGALASALEKLAEAGRSAPMRMGSEATAHMFIVNPFTAGSLAGLFSTHPPVEERVRRLRAMAGSAA